jgi:glutamine synthetase
MLRIFAKAVTKHKRIASEIDNCLAEGFGKGFIDYYLRIKEAELARYHAEVTEWEQREYFELF